LLGGPGGYGVGVGVGLGVGVATGEVGEVGIGVGVPVAVAAAPVGVAEAVGRLVGPVEVGVKLGRLVGVSVGIEVDTCDTGVRPNSVKRQACIRAIKPNKPAPFKKYLLFIYFLTGRATGQMFHRCFIS
jgi:hypothetical protein